MNRREFTGLLAAGVVFPVDYVKGLAARGNVPRSKSGIRIYCCGSDDEPLTEEQSSQIMNFLDRTNQLGPIFDYSRAIGAPVSAIYKLDFPLNRLVVGIGSDDRPAQAEDLIDVKDQLLGLADKWDGSTVVTHHNFYPYEFMGCTLHSAPLVMTHRWAEGALISKGGTGSLGIIRKVPALWHSAFVTEDMRRSHAKVTELERMVV